MIVRTEQNDLLKERMSNDGLVDLDQSLKDLEIDCTLKTAPAIGVTGCFKTKNCLSKPACSGGELHHATGTAASCRTSCGSAAGQGRRKGFATGRSFGGLACWAWVVPWLLVMSGGVVGVKGVPIPDCTYAA